MTVFLIIGLAGLALLVAALVAGEVLDGVLEPINGVLGGDLLSTGVLAGFLGAFGFTAHAVTAAAGADVGSAVGVVAGLLVGAGVGFLTRFLASGRTDGTPSAAALVGKTPAGSTGAGTGRARLLLTAAGLGLGAGLLWGIAARAWMRTVSENPEFTWEGTLFLLAVSSIAGAALALLEALRRLGTGAVRFAVVVPALILFAGQGLPMLPGALLLGFALSARGPRWLSVVAAWTAQVSTVVILYDQFAPLTPYPAYVQVGGYLVLVLALGAAWRSAFLPRCRRA